MRRKKNKSIMMRTTYMYVHLALRNNKLLNFGIFILLGCWPPWVVMSEMRTCSSEFCCYLPSAMSATDVAAPWPIFPN